MNKSEATYGFAVKFIFRLIALTILFSIIPLLFVNLPLNMLLMNFGGMTAYAVAVIRETRFCEEIKEYLLRIDGTLAPFSGKYRIHGGPYKPLEGAWSGDLVVIEFPSMEQAQGWYHSAAYQAIRPLRMDHTLGDVFLVQGVAEGHQGADILWRPEK